MVELIVGKKGKGKTKVLLDKVNGAIKEANGSIVYLDKSTKHMYELNNKVRLIDVSVYPIKNADEFVGFVCGIISQDHDLEQVYLDSFLTTAKLEGKDVTGTLEQLNAVGEKFNVKFVVSMSLDKEEIPESLQDKIVTAFVRRTMEQYPDSLFIITGDHAERMNLSGTPSMFEKHSIPLLVYGQGVTKNLLPTDVAGGHTNLVPTLIELIASARFEYYSIADSMTAHTEVGFNRNNWITKNGMGEMDSAQQEFLPGVSGVDLNQDRQKVKEKAAMMRTISWWLLQEGTSMTGDR